MDPDFYDPFEDFPDVDDSTILIITECFYPDIITTEIEKYEDGT